MGDTVQKLQEAGPIIGSQRKERRIGKEKAKTAAFKIGEQEKKEAARLARESGEVRRREAVAGRARGGRSSLIATTQTGLPSNLGAQT